jgi:hypothetical protein
VTGVQKINWEFRREMKATKPPVNKARNNVNKSRTLNTLQRKRNKPYVKENQ